MGGISFNSTVDLTHLDEALVKKLCQLYRIHGADVLVREDATPDQFIDLLEGNRIYLPCLYVVNKIDLISMYDVCRYAHQPHTVVTSIRDKLNLDYLLAKIWEKLNFLRIYTKPRGQRPSFEEPLILRSGTSVEHGKHITHRAYGHVFTSCMSSRI